MPRAKIKTRVELLAEAHGRMQQAEISLKAVDLRTTAGELRQAIRDSRDCVNTGLAALQRAIEVDTPRGVSSARPPKH